MASDLFYWLSAIIFTSHSVFGSEFSFEIPDSDEQCFYEYVKENEECRLDYQVNKVVNFITNFQKTKKNVRNLCLDGKS